MLVGCGLGEPDQSTTVSAQRTARPPSDTQTRPAVPTDAREVRPLGEGETAAAATLRRPDGEEVDVAALYSEKPTVLVFYRGGWCPYCNAHLGQMATAQPKLLAMGYQVLAVSPDRPEELARTSDEQSLGYTLLSDGDMVLARAFGLAFRVDDSTLAKYRGFGIDLAKASGRDHHLLPVPAVYIIDTSGVICFAHWDADYKKRLEPEALLKVAREVRQAARASTEPRR
jgi:peroxiredoxin